MKSDYPSNLWTLRTPEETRALYADWADAYESDVGSGYKTPARLAAALAAQCSDPTQSLLDFGCGTGLSGLALAAEGFTTIDGTDITAEMLEIARKKPVYRTLWQSEPDDVVPTDHYRMIAAIGVISLGAAPPETLDMLLQALPQGGLLAFSFNDPTLADTRYTGKLDALIKDGTARILSREFGPHLTTKNMNSAVYVIEKTV